MAVEGIDVSHWQGDVDWHAVKKSGRKFAFAKATEGRSMVDEKFGTGST
jgi:lysozyme